MAFSNINMHTGSISIALLSLNTIVKKKKKHICLLRKCTFLLFSISLEQLFETNDMSQYFLHFKSSIWVILISALVSAQYLHLISLHTNKKYCLCSLSSICNCYLTFPMDIFVIASRRCKFLEGVDCITCCHIFSITFNTVLWIQVMCTLIC